MSEWKEYKLNELANIVMGQSPPSSSYNEESLGLPFLQGCADFGDTFPITKYYCTEPKKIAPVNSILISVRAPVGLTNLSNRTFVIGRGLAAIVPNNTNLMFLYYSINQNTSRLDIVSQGSTFTAINSDELNNFKLLAPLIPEQRKIAHILSTIDSVIEKTQSAIDKYKAIKQGMLQDLFTRGIDISTGKLRPRYEDAPELYKESKLGWIPNEWEIKKLGQYSFITKLAGFEYTLYFDYSKSGPIIAVRALNIKQGKLILDNFHTIPKETADLLPRSQLQKGDLVISYVGTVGEVAVIPENNKFHLAPNVAKISVDKKEIDPFYLNQYLNADVGQIEIIKLVSSTTQAALSMQNLREVIFIKPIIEEQKFINQRFENIDCNIHTEQSYLHKLQMLKFGLMSDLLSGKKRVKVDDGDSSINIS